MMLPLRLESVAMSRDLCNRCLTYRKIVTSIHDFKIIQIHATQKLYKKFHLDEGGQLKQDPAAPNAPEKVVDINLLRDWHDYLLTIQRRNCVLLVHNQTRFAVFIPRLTKKEFGRDKAG